MADNGLRGSACVSPARPTAASVRTGFSWLEFFSTAGIPEQHARSYSDVFEDNRIRESMLADLTKEILQVRMPPSVSACTCPFHIL